MPEFLQPLLSLVIQHKFWGLLLAALVASGLTWAADLQQFIPLILLVAGALAGGVKVQERRAAKRAEPSAGAKELHTPSGAEVVSDE